MSLLHPVLFDSLQMANNLITKFDTAIRRPGPTEQVVLHWAWSLLGFVGSLTGWAVQSP